MQQQQHQHHPGGVDYPSQPYNPTMAYPAVAVAMYDGYGHGPGVNGHNPSRI